ncbi:MAG: hypothetical protein LBB61_05375 [Treponema sp.]|nr:hypothetical protein [Treponema sp.]
MNIFKEIREHYGGGILPFPLEAGDWDLPGYYRIHEFKETKTAEADK